MRTISRGLRLVPLAKISRTDIAFAFSFARYKEPLIIYSHLLFIMRLRLPLGSRIGCASFFSIVIAVPIHPTKNGYRTCECVMNRMCETTLRLPGLLIGLTVDYLGRVRFTPVTPVTTCRLILVNNLFKRLMTRQKISCSEFDLYLLM